MHIIIKSNADYASAIDAFRRLNPQSDSDHNCWIWFDREEDEATSHFTDENFSAFANAVQSDPTRKASISVVRLNLNLFNHENAPTQKFAEFLGSLPKLTDLNCFGSCTNPQILAAFLVTVSMQEFTLKSIDFGELEGSVLQGSTQDIIDFAEGLAANQGLTRVAFSGVFLGANNTPEKINPLLKAVTSLPLLSGLRISFWIPPPGCREHLCLICAGSKLECLGISGPGFSMAFAGIQRSTSIQFLHIFDVNLEQIGNELAELLGSNNVTVLKKLHLWSKEPQEYEAFCQLADHLKRNSTITKLGLQFALQGSGHGNFQKKMVEMLRDNTTITWFRIMLPSGSMITVSMITDAMKHFIGLNQLGRKNWCSNQATVLACLDTLMAAREKRQHLHLRDLAETLEGELGALNITYEVLHLMPAIWSDSGS